MHHLDHVFLQVGNCYKVQISRYERDSGVQQKGGVYFTNLSQTHLQVMGCHCVTLV